MTTTSAEMCSLSCENNGLCIGVNTCLCTENEWTGSLCRTPVMVMWPFDYNLNDLYHNYQGVGINEPTYNSPGINGYGTSLYLNVTSRQSVTVSSLSLFNMIDLSFTLSLWIKANSLYYSVFNVVTNANALLSQIDYETSSRILYIAVRNGNTIFTFFNSTLSSNTILTTNTWYHMSFLYDSSTLIQSIYLNGILDISFVSQGSYPAATGDFNIGADSINGSTGSWDGRIDQVAYFARAKNATEILRDATLTLQYTFDNTLLDNGPLGINGTGVNISYSNTGRFNQSLSLSVNQSYVQGKNLILLGTKNQSYSLSVWIKPSINTRGTIIHVSSQTNGLGWCMPMMGFTNTSSINVQSYNLTCISITGPTIPLNRWTHVTVTYSTSVGLRLYVNGTQYGTSTGPYFYSAANNPVTATLGSSLSGTSSCYACGIIKSQYYGLIDEFHIYSRELSAVDVSKLANL
ncbi:hypothetical protein I4U23_010133 [Adineta vaga]|nr:hypothetical protein I4U23_010133 [Adineta vaga]